MEAAKDMETYNHDEVGSKGEAKTSIEHAQDTAVEKQVLPSEYPENKITTLPNSMENQRIESTEGNKLDNLDSLNDVNASPVLEAATAHQAQTVPTRPEDKMLGEIINTEGAQERNESSSQVFAIHHGNVKSEDPKSQNSLNIGEKFKESKVDTSELEDTKQNGIVTIESKTSHDLEEPNPSEEDDGAEIVTKQVCSTNEGDVTDTVLESKRIENLKNSTISNDLKKNIEDPRKVITSIFPNVSNLGTIIYNPTTTWSTLQIDSLIGLREEHREYLEELRARYAEKLKDAYFKNKVKYIPMIPPLPSTYVNSLIEIKIPHRFIREFEKEFTDGEISKRRELWGGVKGVYTDDSEILSVLQHIGVFNNTADLKYWNRKWTHEDVSCSNGLQLGGNYTARDLSVTILLLPTLAQYSGYWKNGIRSRSWLGFEKHDGLSYTVYTYKWENCETYLDEKPYFKRYLAESLTERSKRRLLSTEYPWGASNDCTKKVKDREDIEPKSSIV